MSDDDEGRRPVPAIENLGPRGVRLWNRLTEQYEFRDDELEILSAAARTLDHIAAMEAALDGQPLIVRGSQGQPAANPLLAELRYYRNSLAAYLRTLKVPDPDDDEEPGEVCSLPTDGRSRKPMSRSEAARVAARARWSMRS